MKSTVLFSLSIAASLSGAYALAGGNTAGSATDGSHAGSHGTHAQAGEADTMSQGEIRKVDKEAGKITIKHGELKNLGMPPMTMVFRVKDRSLLDQVKPGDKVSFVADKVGSQYVVTRLKPGN